MSGVFVSTFPFQSTLSLRRATSVLLEFSQSQAYFNPRSPCGERHQISCEAARPYDISIHALLAESDALHYIEYIIARSFQSTLSLRRATLLLLGLLLMLLFQSTLSLRRATAKLHSFCMHFPLHILLYYIILLICFTARLTFFFYGVLFHFFRVRTTPVFPECFYFALTQSVFPPVYTLP